MKMRLQKTVNGLMTFALRMAGPLRFLPFSGAAPTHTFSQAFSCGITSHPALLKFEYYLENHCRIIPSAGLFRIDSDMFGNPKLLHPGASGLLASAGALVH